MAINGNGAISTVPELWMVAPLVAFVSRVTYGFTTPMPSTSDGPYMVTAKDIHDGRIDYATSRHTSWDAYRKLTDKSRPRVNDVLLTKDGSIGRVAICDRDDICINQSVALIQPNERIKSRFLKYLLECPYYQRRMEGDSDGTTIKHIYITRVDKMEIVVPPINEQLAIANILGVLDDKIELNRRTNVTVESMARVLFKSWFVDFEPVRARLDSRCHGLPKEITDLFPVTFQDSEIGDIPRGWSVRSLYNCATFVNGLAFRTGSFSQGKLGLPVIKIAELKSGITSQTKFTKDEFARKYHVRSGDVLFSWSGSPATSIDTFLWTEIDGWLNQHIFKVQFHAADQKLFVYYLLRSLKPVFIEIARNKQTTGLGHVTAEDMKRLKICWPPEDVLRAFDRIAEPLFNKDYSNSRISRSLTELRDTLLPKLISGELRIPDAERIVAGQV
jgi:type I restriction enzyme S subunit